MKTRAEYKSKKTNKEIRSTISTVLMIILIVFFSSIYFILKEVNNVDNPIVVVTSGSMEPVIYRGDMLIVKHKEAEDIIVGTIEDKKGDIILYDIAIWQSVSPS